MGGVDKIFAHVLGRPLLTYSVDIFDRCAAVHAIALVLRPDLVEEGKALARREGWRKIVAVVPGGARRQDSVEAGIEALGPCEWVVVHDGARPCVSQAIIERGLEAARATGAAVAAVPARDTVKTVGPDQTVLDTLPRDRLWLVQTPQVFRYAILRAAYRSATETVTDDASLVERAGRRVKVFMGSYENIKVTTSEDLAVAEALLRGARGQ